MRAVPSTNLPENMNSTLHLRRTTTLHTDTELKTDGQSTRAPSISHKHVGRTSFHRGERLHV